MGAETGTEGDKDMKARERMIWLLPLLLMVVLALPLMAFRAMQTIEPTDLVAVLTWIAAGPGAVAIAGIVLSRVLEWFPAWGAKLTGTMRGLVVVAGSLVFAFGAYFLLKAPPVIASIQPYYVVAVMALLAFAGSQWMFVQQKAAKALTDRVGKGVT
jgi:cation transport ATPase